MVNTAELTKIATELRLILSNIDKILENTEDKKVETKKPKKRISLEQVRLVLATKADGNREKVKDLISKYGANKLTEINPKDYGAIIEEAKNI